MDGLRQVLQAVGYEALSRKYQLDTLAHYRSSYVAFKGRPYTRIDSDHETHVYPKSYLPKNPDDAFLQLEFALKYDGVNLEILAALFKHFNQEEVEHYINGQPTARNARIIWYLFEWLTGKALNIPDIKIGNYVPLLDSEEYYTVPGERSRRHRVVNNLLGNRQFCPIVRKTEALMQFEKSHVDDKAKNLIESYNPEIIMRAIHYLYLKETMSSYAIERERPDIQHQTRFVELLKATEKLEEITKEKLIELQNAIVDPRFSDVDYRVVQNYVGEQISVDFQKIHYISPKPEDVAELMLGLLSTLQSLQNSNVHPIISASVIAFGFVFIHPFEDGNGRLHRFLIHYILSRTHFTPEGVIFPVSSVMLKNIRSYDAILESFSVPLLERIKNYQLTHDGRLSVFGQTKNYYQFIDYTRFSEYLFECVIETVETVFKNELEFIKNYDLTKRAIRNIVDMPDRLIDLIIKFVSQNNGQLSDAKRRKYFYMLSQNEISEIEKTISENSITR